MLLTCVVSVYQCRSPKTTKNFTPENVTDTLASLTSGTTTHHSRQRGKRCSQTLRGYPMPSGRSTESVAGPARVFTQTRKAIYSSLGSEMKKRREIRALNQRQIQLQTQLLFDTTYFSPWAEQNLLRCFFYLFIYLFIFTHFEFISLFFSIRVSGQTHVCHDRGSHVRRWCWPGHQQAAGVQDRDQGFGFGFGFGFTKQTLFHGGNKHKSTP